MKEKDHDGLGHIRLHEERLDVSRETEAREVVPVRISVENETVARTVAITYETVDISTHDITHEHRIGEPIVGPGMFKISLSRERVLVGKATIAMETIEVGRVAHVDHVRAQATLRREELNIVVPETNGETQ